MIANRLDELAALHDPAAPHDTPIEFVVTGGARGVDEWADKAAGDRGLDRVVVPANWKRDGKAGGPIRNRRMASLLRPEAGDFVIAFRAEGESRGTDDMIRQAKARGVEVEIVRP